MTMPSMIWAAVSVASIASSSTANMSFQRITTIGSIPFEKSEATASREIRSPSFSRRWISIQYLSRSLKSGRCSSPWASCSQDLTRTAVRSCACDIGASIL